MVYRCPNKLDVAPEPFLQAAHAFLLYAHPPITRKVLEGSWPLARIPKERIPTDARPPMQLRAPWEKLLDARIVHQSISTQPYSCKATSQLLQQTSRRCVLDT